jgi:hypothetical protein
LLIPVHLDVNEICLYESEPPSAIAYSFSHKQKITTTTTAEQVLVESKTPSQRSLASMCSSSKIKKNLALQCKVFGIACGILLLCVGTSVAQTVTGTLQGTVTDPTGAVVPGAAITIRNKETGLERTLTTSDEGFLYLA